MQIAHLSTKQLVSKTQHRNNESPRQMNSTLPMHPSTKNEHPSQHQSPIIQPTTDRIPAHNSSPLHMGGGIGESLTVNKINPIHNIHYPSLLEDLAAPGLGLPLLSPSPPQIPSPNGGQGGYLTQGMHLKVYQQPEHTAFEEVFKNRHNITARTLKDIEMVNKKRRVTQQVSNLLNQLSDSYLLYPRGTQGRGSEDLSNIFKNAQLKEIFTRNPPSTRLPLNTSPNPSNPVSRTPSPLLQFNQQESLLGEQEISNFMMKKMETMNTKKVSLKTDQNRSIRNQRKLTNNHNTLFQIKVPEDRKPFLKGGKFGADLPRNTPAYLARVALRQNAASFKAKYKRMRNKVEDGQFMSSKQLHKNFSRTNKGRLNYSIGAIQNSYQEEELNKNNQSLEINTNLNDIPINLEETNPISLESTKNLSKEKLSKRRKTKILKKTTENFIIIKETENQNFNEEDQDDKGFNSDSFESELSEDREEHKPKSKLPRQETSKKYNFDENLQEEKEIKEHWVVVMEDGSDENANYSIFNITDLKKKFKLMKKPKPIEGSKTDHQKEKIYFERVNNYNFFKKRMMKEFFDQSSREICEYKKEYSKIFMIDGKVPNILELPENCNVLLVSDTSFTGFDQKTKQNILKRIQVKEKEDLENLISKVKNQWLMDSWGRYITSTKLLSTLNKLGSIDELNQEYSAMSPSSKNITNLLQKVKDPQSRATLAHPTRTNSPKSLFTSGQASPKSSEINNQGNISNINIGGGRNMSGQLFKREGFRKKGKFQEIGKKDNSEERIYERKEESKQTEKKIILPSILSPFVKNGGLPHREKIQHQTRTVNYNDSKAKEKGGKIRLPKVKRGQKRITSLGGAGAEQISHFQEMSTIWRKYNVKAHVIYELRSEFESLIRMEAEETGNLSKMTAEELRQIHTVSIDTLIKFTKIISDRHPDCIDPILMATDIDNFSISFEDFVKIHCLLVYHSGTLTEKANFWKRILDPDGRNIVPEERYGAILEKLGRGSFNKDETLISRAYCTSTIEHLKECKCIDENGDLHTVLFGNAIIDGSVDYLVLFRAFNMGGDE